ncbi:MAG: MFS transporter [Chloroflexota bacterium]|nr:MFS transporter [Chloroflexota bacterium]
MPQTLRQPSPRTAVSTFFAVVGFISAGWIARIPALTDKLDLDTAQLGTLLLFIAIGSILAFQFIGRLIEHYGSDRTTFLFSIGFVTALVLMGLSPSPAVLAVTLFLYGFGFGATDVAMNAQGVTVEHRLRKPIMGSLHGYFSLGALLGGAISAVFAQFDIRLEANLIAFSVLGYVLVVWANRGQIRDEPIPADEAPKKKGLRFSLPPRVLWPLGVIAFCGAVGEGAMADWGALYVHDELSGTEGMAAFGFTMFSTTMLIGRFAGDKIVARFGPGVVVRVGAIVSALGLTAGLLVGTTISAIVGFAVMGIGLAFVFPVVYSAAGSTPGIPSGRGVAAVATIGYTGFLAGPPLLGFLARATSIQASLLIVAALIAIIAPFTPALDTSKRRAMDHETDLANAA